MASLKKYLDDFFTNWREYDAPVHRKLALTARNRLLSTGRLRECCGHPGEPGC